MFFPNTYTPYKEVERDLIQYTYCVDYPHICRCKALRQVIHQGKSPGRYVALETVNPFETKSPMRIYTVPSHLENRLDLIAEMHLGSATYAWILAYINHIEDGFSVLEGMQLRIPVSVSALFNKDEILAPVSVTKMNLGSE